MRRDICRLVSLTPHCTPRLLSMKAVELTTQPTTICTSCREVITIAMNLGMRNLLKDRGYMFVFLLFCSPQSPEGIVSVHEGVDPKVHDHKPARRCRVLTEWVPAVDQHCHMVVPAGVNSSWNHWLFVKLSYQWRNIKRCFLRTMKIVSPSSGSWNVRSYDIGWRVGDYLWQDKHPGPESTHSVSLNETESM